MELHDVLDPLRELLGIEKLTGRTDVYGWDAPTGPPMYPEDVELPSLEQLNKLYSD